MSNDKFKVGDIVIYKFNNKIISDIIAKVICIEYDMI